MLIIFVGMAFVVIFKFVVVVSNVGGMGIFSVFMFFLEELCVLIW